MGKNTNRAIALITTGGTIGAAFSKGVTTLGKDTGGKNLRAFAEKQAAARGCAIRVFAPLNKFSEDFAPADWGAVLEQIEDCRRQGFTRVIVAHGTDTLAYTSFAAALYYGAGQMRICFVCSHLPASEPGSDAFANTAAALECVRADTMKPGVYAACHSGAGKAVIIRAQDLKPMMFDEQVFSGIYGMTAGHYDGKKLAVVRGAAAPILRASLPAPAPRQLAAPRIGIFRMPCHPGMTLMSLKLDPKRENLVILENYHSGTVPALALRKELKALRRSHPKTRVIAAAHPARTIENPYETTAELAREGLFMVYKDMPPHQLHVLALCETAKGASLEAALKLAKNWRFSA